MERALKTRFIRAGLIGATMALIVPVAGFGQDQPRDARADFHVRGSRALGEAVCLVQSRLGGAVTYEDPGWPCRELTDELMPGFSIPKRETIRFSCDATASAAEWTEALVERYCAQQDRLEFAVRPSRVSPNVFHIVPTRTLSTEGEPVACGSLLDHRISINVRAGTFREITEAICARVSDKAGLQLVVGFSPAQAYDRAKTDFVAEDRPAVDCLDRLFEEFREEHGVQIIWRIYGGPLPPDMAVLNLLSANKPAHAKDDAAPPFHVRILAPRPLDEAIRLIGREMQTPISYEDPTYVCRCEMMMKDDKPYALSGGLLDFSFDRASSPEAVLLAALEVNRRSGYGVFSLRQSQGMLHVFPVVSKNEKAEWQPCHSLLETPISAIAKGDARVLLAEIANSLSAKTGKTFAVGELPDLPFLQRILRVRIKDQPAREILTSVAKLFGEYRAPLGWEVFYDPITGTYLITLYSTASEGGKDDVE